MTLRFLRLVAPLVMLAGSSIALASPALERGLVAHLPFQNDLLDHSAKPGPVKVNGQVELRSGAAWFGGKQDWLELPFIPLFERPYTIAVWLKPTGTSPTYGVLMQRDNDQVGHFLHLMIRDGLRPWFGFYLNDVVSPVSLSNAGDWQHVVFQYTGTHQQIWINGRLICRRASDAYLGTAGRTFIGKNPNWDNVPGKNYEGWMSDFRIYQRSLTYEEIVALGESRPATLARLSNETTAAPAAQPPGSVAPPGASDVPLLSIDAEKMQLRGKAGEVYVVEASQDLQKWTEIGTLTVGDEGFVSFVDEEARRFRQRFYRIRFRVGDNK